MPPPPSSPHTSSHSASQRSPTMSVERLQRARPYSGGQFQKIGSEESHTVESFERRIGGTDTSEPKREFSTNQYTERRTYGRDENGELVVRIETNPRDPVRPVTPVEPVAPVGGYPEHLLKPAKPLEALPLTIPRVQNSRQDSYDGHRQDHRGRQNSSEFGHDDVRELRYDENTPRSSFRRSAPHRYDQPPVARYDMPPAIRYEAPDYPADNRQDYGYRPERDVYPAYTANSGRRSAGLVSPARSVTIQVPGEMSPRSVDSVPMGSPRSGTSSASLSPGAIPMKKIIKKTRLVSVYDGRPVSPYVETVTYEPKYQSIGYDVAGFGGDVHSRSASRLSQASQRSPRSEAGSRRVSASNECTMLVVNPLYSEY